MVMAQRDRSLTYNILMCQDAMDLLQGCDFYGQRAGA